MSVILMISEKEDQLNDKVKYAEGMGVVIENTTSAC